MHDLMSIGRFAQRSGLTVKALRLYDRMGLLRPALVDLHSGYRSYSPEQLALAERIRLLRSVEMPLEEIRDVLAARDGEEIRARLAEHRHLIERRIEAQRMALATLEEFERSLVAMEENKVYRCSFCGKERAEVQRMIAGPGGVIICNECVQLCNEIIAKAEAEEASA